MFGVIKPLNVGKGSLGEGKVGEIENMRESNQAILQ
jgi:hypothetical protein